MPNCSDCMKKGCRQHELEKVPDNCPSKGIDYEKAMSLYTEEEKRTARLAAIAEAESWHEKFTRVEDIMNYAYLCNYNRLGLAFCAGFIEEARTLSRILRKNGFQVDSVICKNGSVGKECLNLEEKQKVHPYQFEAMCHPIGQAFALNKAHTEFNIVLGLCVGHDTLFFKHSEAPVTVLASKDRALGHNPIMALYIVDSYYPRIYDFIKNKYGISVS